MQLVPLDLRHAAVLHASPRTGAPAGLTGTHHEFTRAEIDAWCASRSDTIDRLDPAIERRDTGALLGDLAVMDLDPANASTGSRIALGPDAVGQGHRTEATQLVVDHLLGLGLHQIQLEVFDFNERARRAYERCGFVVEGRLRDALHWDRAWHDALVMAVVAG